MYCNQCKRSNFRKLNGRFFCADCGTDAKSRLSSFAPKPKTVHHTERLGHHKHVLDLTKSPIQAGHQPSIQGAPADSLNHPQANIEQNDGSKQANINTVAAPQISRFHTAKTTPVAAEVVADTAATGPTFPAKPMSAHHSYSIAAKDALAAKIATYHGRHEQSQAQHQPGAMVHPSPVAVAPPAESKRPRWQLPSIFNSLMALPYAKVAAISLSMVVLSGYVTYLNYPNIALRVAAGRAGVSATMPGYTPSGYSFKGPITYGSSRLSVNFSNRKNDELTLEQSRTNWDSASLFENVVKTAAEKYQIFQEDGLTIYVYDTTATWVNGGVWYTITGSNSLNPDEIVKMASSL